LYMVSVGINNAIGQPPLQAVAKDAKDMAKWARTQQGKLFSQVHVTTLTDNQATKSSILSHLSGLRSKAKPGDYVLFYVSCHGSTKDGEYYFCEYDGNVFWNQIMSALREVPGPRIAILDTCFAGAAKSDEQLVVFAACLANQFSHDGSSAGGNSIYTQFLLEGLYGSADANKNGVITLAEAANHSAAKLKAVYQGKAPKDQQFSTWSKPKAVSADLPLAKVGPPVNVAGSTWSGSESLGGYGKLTFEMQPAARQSCTTPRAPSQAPGPRTATRSP